MKKSEKVFERMKKARLVVLLNPESSEECVRAYEMCEAQNVTLEIAYRSEHASEGIGAILDKHPEALVLAGTVMTGTQAEEAIRAGAAGVVSADYIPEVVDACVSNDVMCIPGGLSDAGKQLVRKASGYGCTLEDLRRNYPYQWVYKLFPAFAGEVSNIGMARAWRGPYRDLEVVYTGGVTLEMLKEAVQQDPGGIFCASALTKYVREPEKMKKEIEMWKEAISVEVTRKKMPSTGKKRAGVEAQKVVTFGELMLRLSPPAGVRLEQAANFDVHFGGAEANVAVSLAQFGLRACFVSALPDNDIGNNAVGTLKKYGVDTGSIVRRGKRMGIYYLEHGHGARPSKVIYDRAYSAVSELRPEDVEWEKILEGAGWFHWTGITPALSGSLQETLRNGLKAARQMGITVSADLNFRKKLWSEEEAEKMMTGLMPYVDIMIGNEEDPMRVFGIQVEGTDVESGKLSVDGYRELTKALVERFGFKKAAITLRESLSASENYWSACMHDGRTFVQGPRHRVWIMDRVGTGDAFAAGLIFGFLGGKKDAEALAFGVSAACLKHSIWGDFNAVSVEEVERLAAGHISGRVER
jgi:2-dehydro-3-deoxygluconokinase